MTASSTRARPAKSTKPRRSNKERRAQSDRQIIQAAQELFARQGYQQTSLIQIGKLAGYTGTLISNRFGSKHQLLSAVLTSILNRFEESEKQSRAVLRNPVEIGQGETPPDAVLLMRDFVQGYIDDALQHPTRLKALYVIMGEGLGNIPEIQDDLKRVNLVFRRHVEGLIQYGVDQGQFAAETNPATHATIIVGTLRGVATQLFTEPDQADHKGLLPALQDSIVLPLLA